MANLAKASPEPGLYKGTHPSVLEVPFGRESRRQARGKPRRSRPAASSSSPPPSPSSTPRRAGVGNLADAKQGPTSESRESGKKPWRLCSSSEAPQVNLLSSPNSSTDLHAHTSTGVRRVVIHLRRRRSGERACDGDEIMKVRPATTPHRRRRHYRRRHQPASSSPAADQRRRCREDTEMAGDNTPATTPSPATSDDSKPGCRPMTAPSRRRRWHREDTEAPSDETGPEPPPASLQGRHGKAWRRRRRRC
ncbi:hypothetical protein PVAP13_8KG002002 [Panicum virgatum]|uniref:Uncharacterized protein n=1 Tax=Panicum virgatum TaxID=38727 RepID=A0A8T0PDF5_PANVG|nr:hypothetical protein PVAP13_8KG002002 [Panicum virgatum]